MSIAAALRYARPMLVFDRGEQRFCYRVAAVIVDRGRVLIQLVEEGPDTSETPFYCLPGGRVEHGETALECIAREMREELEEEVQVERLLWLVENFFAHAGMTWHEIGLYFLVSLAEGSRFLASDGQKGLEVSQLPGEQSRFQTRRSSTPRYEWPWPRAA